MWFTAPSGAGKSVVVRQFCRNVSGTYLSIDANPPPTPDRVLQRLVGELVENLPDLYPSARRPSGRPTDLLRTISSARPGTTLVIDHVQRLPRPEARRFICALSRLAFDTIFVSKSPPPTQFRLRLVQCPPLSEEEISAFRRLYAPKTAMPLSALATLSQGQALPLRLLLSSGITSIAQIIQHAPVAGVQAASAAVAITGGYVEEAIFRRAFGVDVHALAWLQQTGLLALAVRHYQAHDQLVAAASTPSARLLGQAGRFLATQALRWRQDLWANRALLSFVASHGYTSTMVPAIESAAAALIRVNDWDNIIDALDRILLDFRSLPGPTLFIAAEAAHIAKHDVVDKVTTALRPFRNNRTVANQLRIIRSERLFWQGDFQTSARLATKAIAQTPPPPLAAQARLNLAIAKFFQGKWDSALADLGAIASRNASLRTRGWAQLISGTVHALRGENLPLGIGLLQRAIQLLQSIGDEVGSAIAWNNLGEVWWKSGELRSAVVCLGTARDLSKSRGDRATELESTRNLLHTHLRLDGPNAPTVSELRRELMALLKVITDLTEHMQAWNTLATVALYQDNRKEAKRFIAKARQYTKGNPEYEIYTHGNAACTQRSTLGPPCRAS